MKTLSYALIAASFLAVGPALAGEASFGKNQFHGSSTLASYAATVNPAETRQQVAAARPEAGQAKPAMVWGDRAVDPIYFNLSAQAPVRGESPAAQGAGTADAIDFGLAYAD